MRAIRVSSSEALEIARGGDPRRLCDACELEAAALLEQEAADRRRATNDLARVIHERVVQRMFAVSLALDGEAAFDDEGVRAECAEHVQRALAELREILRDFVQPEARRPGPSLEDELAHLEGDPLLAVSRSGVHDAPGDGAETIVRSVLAEAVRNARKHADPERIAVTLHRGAEALELTVDNDGVRAPVAHGTTSAGVGLQLALIEAAQEGGLVEYGPRGPHGWRVRLHLPIEEAGR